MQFLALFICWYLPLISGTKGTTTATDPARRRLEPAKLDGARRDLMMIDWDQNDKTEADGLTADETLVSTLAAFPEYNEEEWDLLPIVDEQPAVDIENASHFTIQEAKLRTEQENTRSAAERQKELVSERVKELRKTVTKIRADCEAKNVVLDENDYIVDADYMQKLRLEMSEKEDLVRKTLAWDVEVKWRDEGNPLISLTYKWDFLEQKDWDFIPIAPRPKLGRIDAAMQKLQTLDFKRNIRHTNYRQFDFATLVVAELARRDQEEVEVDDEENLPIENGGDLETKIVGWCYRSDIRGACFVEEGQASVDASGQLRVWRDNDSKVLQLFTLSLEEEGTRLMVVAVIEETGFAVDHRVRGTQVDIENASHFTIQEAKLRTEQENIRSAAERQKELVRKRVKELRKTVTKIRADCRLCHSFKKLPPEEGHR